MDNSEGYPLPEIKIPVLGQKIKSCVKAEAARIDGDIASKGLAAAFREAFARKGLTYSAVYDLEGTQRTMAENPILLVGTHTDFLGTYAAITQLPGRDDIYMIGNSDYLSIGENFRRHLIPIYGVSNQGTTNIRSKLWRRFGYGEKNFPFLEGGRKNAASLAEGVARLRGGALVIIWPDGSQGKDSPWFSSVGEIMLDSKDTAGLKVIFFEARTDYGDLAKAKFSSRSYSGVVRFSKPYSTDTFLVTEHKKVVTKALRSEYISWFGASRK